jgi:alpha-1,6-mannosyltransferase
MSPERTPLRVADVALFYGERSGGIRTYLDAKRSWAAQHPDIEHHVLLPGARELHEDGRHELPATRIATPNGYRLPLGVDALRRTLRDLQPDVVLLHDPFWGALRVTTLAHSLDARVVAVHHGSSALNAAGMRGPDVVWRRFFTLWMRQAYRHADGVLSAVDPTADSGREATIPLRFGVDRAFRPDPGLGRGDHVLYAGRLAREKGVLDLVHAMARSRERWTLRMMGSGPAAGAILDLARRLGVAGRIQLRPFVRDPERLARAYGRARAVVMPGAHETFGLVALEAAASGARAVACETAPSAAVCGDLVETFRPGDADDLAAAIDRARAAPPADPARAEDLGRRCSWDQALGAELTDLRRLVAA